MSYMLEESEAVSFDAPITWNINKNYKEKHLIFVRTRLKIKFFVIKFF